MVRARRPEGGFPAIVCGDFNALPDAAEIRHMVGRQSIDGVSTFFQDAFEVAGVGDGTTMTEANGFVTDTPMDMRLDYVFVGRAVNGLGRIDSCRVVANEAVDGVYPSDHFGVYVELAS